MNIRICPLLGSCLLASVALAHDDASHRHALPPGVLAQTMALPSVPLGSGEWRFAAVPGWAKLAADVALGPTHGGVAFDQAGNVYVSSDGPAGILVFNREGTFLRSIAPSFSGIHSFTLREEEGKTFIYAARPGAHDVLKLGLDGTLVWKITAPMESGLYTPPADGKKATPFSPTALAVVPDGRIFVADGYGASVIHVFDRSRTYVKTIGRKGEGVGEFKTCHGLVIDPRFEVPRLLVADRENKRLVHLDLEGNWLGVYASDLRRPCAFAFRGENVAVAELQGRVAILNKKGELIAALGDNPDQKQWAAFKLPPEQWRDGIFVAPHGIAFDGDGNLYVQDWNFVGRFTKLKKL